jgi:ER lumen protein retaining receptor
MKIRKTRSCVGNIYIIVGLYYASKNVFLGISFKTQVLYSLVFITRYLDVFIKNISIYNTVMKVFFTASSLYILYLMRFKYQATYDKKLDNFQVEYLLVGSLAMGLLTTYDFNIIEVKKDKRMG